MRRFGWAVLILATITLLQSPAVAKTPAPMVDDGIFSFAVDVHVMCESVAVAKVHIERGAARSYGRHPDQFRIIATGNQGRPPIQITTFDPRWQRVYDLALEEGPRPSSDEVQSRQHLTRDQSMEQQTLPAEPDNEREHTQSQARQMRDLPIHTPPTLN